MEELLTGLAKAAIKSVFTVQKYNSDILYEDLDRIVFIRNLIEESAEYIKANCKGLKVANYNKAMKEYALELYILQCMEAIPDEDKKDEDFDIEEEKEDIINYFEYIYKNLKFPE